MPCASCSDEDEYNHESGTCIEGVVYGFCSSEYCGGVCEDIGRCSCLCHETPAVRAWVEDVESIIDRNPEPTRG